MKPAKISVTVPDRVILHLLDYLKYEGRFEAPMEVTQTGIASAVGIEQKHVPRAVKKLKAKGYVHERLSRVEGIKQRRKVYFLTWDGVVHARKLRETLEEKTILVRDVKGIVVEARLGNVNDFLEDDMELPIVNVLKHISHEGVFDCSTFKRTFAPKAEAPEAPWAEPAEFPEKHRIYEGALRRAWSDGMITTDERAILEDLRKLLKITEKEHKELETRITEELEKAPEAVIGDVDREAIYKAALRQAWMDGCVSGDEADMLACLRKILKITDEEHRRMDVEARKGGRAPC
jgi:DNA-binding MarR family transcriptional regulator